MPWRGGAVVQSIHRAGFAAVGATWEPIEDVLHRNKGLVLTHGRAAPAELRRYACRAKTLHSLSGRKQTQEMPHYTCALDMLQVCDDARAGAVLNDFAQIYVFSPTSTIGHGLHAHGQHARGRRLPAHARGQARPRQRLTALRPRRGRAPGHGQAAACHLRLACGRLAHQESLLGRRIFMAGHERHLGVARRLFGAAVDGHATSEA